MKTVYKSSKLIGEEYIFVLVF